MNKEEFLNLVWRLDEILMQADYLRGQIGKCEDKCDIEDEGLCARCCDDFGKVLTEEDRLAENKELDEILKKLKHSCDEDESGEYQRILDQSRDGRVFH